MFHWPLLQVGVPLVTAATALPILGVSAVLVGYGLLKLLLAIAVWVRDSWPPRV